MLAAPILSGVANQTWYLTLSSNESNVNLRTKLEALYGTMSGAVNAIVTVASGVTISSTSAGYPALTTNDAGSDWPSGSKLKLINNGNIYGAGGVGASFNGPGSQGGDAVSTRMNITIDNTNGYIFAGGGGGGPSGSYEYRLGWTGSFWYYWNEGDPLYDPPAHAAGAGGGGQGSSGGPGGTGDIADGASNGSAGTVSGGGAGAAGVYNGGLAGGAGGSWGETGETGQGAGYTEDGWDHSESGSGKHWRVAGRSNGGAGSPAGKAVRKTYGKTVTWLGGNNATQVKGAVS